MTAMPDTKPESDYEKWDRFLEEPMPDGHSLEALFRHLGIDNMLSGGPDSGEWGHIDLDRLDWWIKWDSTRWDGTPPRSSFELFHTTRAPVWTWTPVGSEGSAISDTDFGKIEQPYVVAEGNVRYTFLSAAYDDGEIIVTVKIGRKKGETVERELSVAALREMIVIKKPLWRRLSRR